MAEKFEVPEKRCKNGHVIPVNGAVVGEERGSDGKWYPIVLKNSRLICEQCAIEAGGGELIEPSGKRMRRGKKLEKLGQESFLDKVPAKFII